MLDADPDLIFLAHTDGTGQDPAEVAARPGWDELQAVRNDAVVVLDSDISSRWGPRIVELLAWSSTPPATPASPVRHERPHRAGAHNRVRGR